MPGEENTIKNPDILALKSFIQAKDAVAHAALDPDMVVLDLTHSNLQQKHIETRFYKKDLLLTLRERIYRKTGTPPADQHLQVYDGDQLVSEIPANASDDYLLGRFGLLHHGMQVHCIDMNPYSASAGGAYENVDLVEKFRLSDEAYEAREKPTLRNWAKEQKKKNPNFSLQQHAADHRALVEAQRAHRLGLTLPEGFFVDSAGQVVRDEPDVLPPSPEQKPNKEDEEDDPEYGKDSVSHAILDARCQVSPGERRGRVAFIGKIPEITAAPGGWWVGVVLDEPSGQNDGSFGGKQYFETPGPKYGCVVRGKHLLVGDYPEQDWLADSSDDEDEL